MLRPAALLAAILLLSGCVPGQPVVTPAPEPSSTPIFATDEDALAAATAAFAKYLKVSDDILADGGVEPERVLDVATSEWANVQYAGYEQARASGLRSIGSTSFDSVRLQQYDHSAADGAELVRIYVCVDVSKLDVVNSDGKSVVTNARPARTPFEVTFDATNALDRQVLKVASEDQWGGEDFCG